jgi:hypothetical protein
VQVCDPDYVHVAKNIKRFDLILPATPLEVFAVVAGKDEEIWFPNFKHTRWMSDGAQQCVGARREYAVAGLTMMENFTLWEPGKRLSFYMSSMSIPYCSRFMELYEITPRSAEETALTWRICFEPSIWFRPVFPLVRHFFEQDFERAATNLRRYFDGTLTGRAPPRRQRALEKRWTMPAPFASDHGASSKRPHV